MKIRNIIKQNRISVLEESLYQIIAKNDDLTVKKLATLLKRPVQSINRTVNLLSKKGFIQILGKYPKKLKAIPLEIVLAQQFSQLSGLNTAELQNDFPLSFLPSRKIYHQVGENLFSQVRSEVLLISSGTGELGAEYYKTIVKKILAGVKYKILVLSNDEDNNDLVRNWQKNGIEVRYKKGKGFNLVVYDRKKIQLGVRVTENSKEKWGIVIKNESLGQFMGEFFDDMWNKSELL